LILRHRRRELNALADVVLAVLAYLALVAIYVVPRQRAVGSWYELLVPWIIVVWWIASALIREDLSYRMRGAGEELLETVEINAVGGLLVLAFEAITRHPEASRLVLTGFPVLSAALSLTQRGLTRALIGVWRRGGADLQHLLVVGPLRAAEQVVAQLCHPSAGLRLVGVLVPPAEAAASPAVGPVLGEYGALSDVLFDRVIDQVVVVAPLTDPGVREAIEAATTEGKTVWLQLDAFGAKITGQSPGRLMLISPWKDPLRLGIKRLLDIVLASVALVVSSPLMAACALSIKLDDPAAPVLFKQARVGLHGRRFACYKFRTMTPDAERRQAALLPQNEMSGPVFKMRNDPRVTRVGKLLRRYSLDELPQLWNVLLGDMSLVGPRPLMVDHVRPDDAAFRRRLAFRPGLTCLWQVSGRNKVDFVDWMELDLQYVDNWSLALDARILLRTVGTVLTGSGV
jgi:exopolysaccharide biosynthesis polyprenyl glycosylphosphotransferase